ncbi:MAG: hypothetical protein IPL61_28215 [Myxococcales bacterium]|nr:hypothetical protein [Myxococcales bacterium]
MNARLCAGALLVAAAACGGGDSGPPKLTGLVLYEDRAQLASGRLDTTLQLLPARGVTVSLINEADGAVITTVTTDDDGRYTVEWVEPLVEPTEPLHLLAAAMSMAPERPIQVVRRNSQVHGFGGDAFTWEDKIDVDLVVTEASGAAAAFNVFDMAVSSADAVRTNLDVLPAPLTAIWEKGSNDGTYYSGDSRIHLLGAASDDDGYDDTVILHEIGHFFEDTVGRSDSPGGGHDGSPTNPNLAWSEGFSTYWAMAVKNEPFYGDSNSGGGWGYNAETTVTRAPQPAGSIGQAVGENLITEVLWDIGDAPSGDDDQLAGDHIVVESVQPMYLRTSALRQVGQGGVDLVDFLDGYFVLAGLRDCAAVRQIVVTTHTFPYDFGGPAGPCP